MSVWANKNMWGGVTGVVVGGQRIRFPVLSGP